MSVGSYQDMRQNGRACRRYLSIRRHLAGQGTHRTRRCYVRLEKANGGGFDFERAGLGYRGMGCRMSLGYFLATHPAYATNIYKIRVGSE